MDYKDIKFEHQLQSETYIQVRQKITIVLIAMPSIFWIPFSAFVLFDPAKAASDPAHAIRIAFLCLLMIATFTYFVIFLSLDGFDDDKDFDWDWLHASYCDDLANLCSTHSDLNDYRLQVIAEGRRFTWEEYVAMKNWPERKRAIQLNLIQQKNRDAMCKALYES